MVGSLGGVKDRAPHSANNNVEDQVSDNNLFVRASLRTLKVGFRLSFHFSLLRLRQVHL